MSSHPISETFLQSMSIHRFLYFITHAEADNTASSMLALSSAEDRLEGFLVPLEPPKAISAASAVRETEAPLSVCKWPSMAVHSPESRDDTDASITPTKYKYKYKCKYASIISCNSSQLVHYQSVKVIKLSRQNTVIFEIKETVIKC